MLAQLKFVQGAVAKKDFVPALSHFAIRSGKILGYNGQIALCSPIALTLEATPNAKTFIKAIQACGENIQFNVTPANKLSIKSGSFKAFVACVENETFPTVEPTGVEMDPPHDFMDAIETLAPFVSEDASKQWSRGIMFRGRSAFATNNVILLEYWLGTPFPHELNIPAECVAELLRIKEDPVKLMVSDNSISFLYEGGRWLHSSLYSTAWPDVADFLEFGGHPEPVPPGFFEAVEALKPFTDKLDSIYLLEDEITTSLEEGEGASIDVKGVLGKARYSAEHLLLLKDVVTLVDFRHYPSPGCLRGKNVRGRFTGMRL